MQVGGTEDFRKRAVADCVFAGTEFWRTCRRKRVAMRRLPADPGGARRVDHPTLRGRDEMSLRLLQSRLERLERLKDRSEDWWGGPFTAKEAAGVVEGVVRRDGFSAAA